MRVGVIGSPHVNHTFTLQWGHNGCNGISNHQPHEFYSTVYSGVDQRKHQSSASLAFVWGIHRWPVNSPHKWPVTREIFPFDDVIMMLPHAPEFCHSFSKACHPGSITGTYILMPYLHQVLGLGSLAYILRSLTLPANSLRHNDVIWLHRTSLSLFGVMAWGRTRAKPLPQTMMTHCQLGP